jgi:hypothetical protein
MKPTAPYYLSGEAGKSLDEVQISLADLCCYNATLSLRSLDVDTLTFQILGSRSKVIPDDGQWISLYDGTGTRLFTGIAKRTYTHPQGIYSYEVSNVYLGLQQSVLLTPSGDATLNNPNPNRPYVVCDQGSLAARITFLLSTAAAEGLPIQAPASLPPMFDVPKQAFRASSISGALEDTLKWLPDVSTRMDYTTNPPTLRFYTRTASTSTTINLDSPNHHTTAAQLAAWPEARAAYVAFVYAERSGDTAFNYRIQEAGDNSAEARKKISVYLSGGERTDMLVSETLMNAKTASMTANAALEGAKAALAVTNAAALQTLNNSLSQIPAASAQFDLMTAVKAGDAAIKASSFTFESCRNITYYPYFGFDTKATSTGPPLAGYPPVAGWVPYYDVFTAAQLSSVGVSSGDGSIQGWAIANISGSPVPAGFLQYLSGYSSGSYSATTVKWCYKAVNVPIKFFSVAPSEIVSRLNTLANSNYNSSIYTALQTTGAATFIDNAAFVPAPADLATNYFARQDWTPFKGSLSLDPKAADFPEPGDYLNIAADSTPAEWASMAAPVSELSIDLSTGAAEVKIGPSPRMDFQSLIDRLRIPVEDNYQAG